jgi:ectoine hydroxylase-related dioxygenase (phytanoyl-CoA dioxygenase family)
MPYQKDATSTLGERLEPWCSWRFGRPPGFFDLPLSPEAAAFYHEAGYVVIESALADAEVAALNAEAARICRGEGLYVDGVARAGADEPDAELMQRYLCIHFPHKISDRIAAALAYPALVEVLTAIIGPNVKCMQSMLFVKASGKPGQAWHQDECFIPTRDRSLTGAWIALDDATVENGCLWVIPGSQRHGLLWSLEEQDDPRFDCSRESQGFPYHDEDAVPVEVKQGSVVFFNGYLLHRSLPNYAPSGFRRALVNHYMSAESLLPWFGFQPGRDVGTADYRDVVLVAGRDPYGWKGYEERARAHVRPSGEGGCAPRES